MDINIEAPHHGNQEGLKRYYELLLNKKYGNYPFINSIDVSVVVQTDGNYKVGLRTKPENGNALYCSGVSRIENQAAYEAVIKMNRLIEKYKQRHYHRSNSAHKMYTL